MAIKTYIIGIETDAQGCLSDFIKSNLDLKPFGDMVKNALIDYCKKRDYALLDLYIYEADAAHGMRKTEGGYVYNLNGVYYG